jgi:hypothetical protein
MRCFCRACEAINTALLDPQQTMDTRSILNRPRFALGRKGPSGTADFCQLG